MQYVTSIERRGIEKGRTEGRTEGSAELLLRLLRQRFGALEEAAQKHVRALPLEKLEALSDVLFSLTTPSDLEAWLQQHPLPAPNSMAN